MSWQIIYENNPDNRKKSLNNNIRTLKIWVFRNHAYAMLPKEKIKARNEKYYDLLAQTKEKQKADEKKKNQLCKIILPRDYEDINGVIVRKEEKKRKGPILYSDYRKVVAYDLEASLVKNDSGLNVFKCYAFVAVFMRPTEDLCKSMKLYMDNIGETFTTDEIEGKTMDIETIFKGKKEKHDLATVLIMSKEDPIKKIFKFVYHFREFFNHTIWFAHNGGKFDVPLVLNEYFFKDSEPDFIVDSKGTINSNNRYINLRIILKNPKVIGEVETRNGGKRKVKERFVMTWKDTFAYMPGSLARLTNELNSKFRKLTGEIDHNQITLDNFHTFDKLRVYTILDGVSLFELVLTFRAIVLTITENKVDILDCCTGASLAKNTFLECFYNPFTKPIYSLSDHYDKYIRESYLGGRVECNRLGIFSNGTGEDRDILEKFEYIQYLDFTSFYPANGAFNDLPYGVPNKVQWGKTVGYNDDTKLPDQFFGFVKCLVYTNPTHYGYQTKRYSVPLHGYKMKNGLLSFPIFRNATEQIFFSEEVREGIKSGIYTYKFIDGLNFRRGKILDDAFIHLFKLKNKYRQEKKESMSWAAKIILNSLYGGFGMRYKDRTNLYISSNEMTPLVSWFNEGRVVDFTMAGSYEVVSYRGDIPSTKVSVGLAAAITSYSRMGLWRLRKDLHKYGGIVYYCDTDSVIVGLNHRCFEDIPDLFEKYMMKEGKITDGKHLGGLKNELGPKETISGLVIGGNKMYAIKPTNTNYKEIVKCKGYCQGSGDELDFNRMKEMFEKSTIVESGNSLSIECGSPISQVQKQFIQNPQRLIDGKRGVEMIEISKNISIQYNKGTLVPLSRKQFIINPLLI